MKIVCQKLFNDFNDAAVKLLDSMPINKFRRLPTVIVAISYQAIPIAKKIAKITNSQDDILISVDIEAPANSELAVARVSESKDIVMQKDLVESFDIKEDFIYNQATRKHEEQIVPLIYKYRKGDAIERFENKYVILVDCGAETGLTVMTAIKSAINLGAKNIYFATPVIPKDLQTQLNSLIDDIFTPFAVDDYVNTKFYYTHFNE